MHKGTISRFQKFNDSLSLESYTVADLINTGLNISIFMGQGDVYVDNSRKVGNITGNTFGNNNNFLGDNVNQISDSSVFESAYKDLLTEVNKITDEDIRDQAESNAELLKEAIDKNDTPKIEKFLRFLGGTLGVVQPLLLIAQLAGVPIPNIPTP